MTKPCRYLGEEISGRGKGKFKGLRVGDACCDAKVEQSKGQYGCNETSENDKVREMPETDHGWG